MKDKLKGGLGMVNRYFFMQIVVKRENMYSFGHC